MVLSNIPVTLVPVAVSIATSFVIIYTLIICACRKRSNQNEPELTDVKIQGNSTTVQSASSPAHKSIAEQNNITDPSSIQLEPDTAITPIEPSTRQNGTLHSRGNSADLTKPDRHSGTSSGSSPRQATLSRELPDIPIQSRDKGNHSHLPEVPTTARNSTFKQESNPSRGGHSHSQLPDIPKSHTLASERGGNLPEIPVSQRNKSPTIPRTSAESKSAVRLSTEVPVANSNDKVDLDDYDHITESKPKKMRPRSDYDHVLIEGGQKRIIPAKHVDDPDYAEVRNENIYEGVPDDVTVVPVKTSKPNTPSNVTQTKGKTSIIVGKAPVKETCVDLDPPYNKIKDESSNVKDRREPPYNKIKDEPPYSGVKDGTDPYNTVKDADDDPYNKVVGDDEVVIDSLDDIDPYNTVQDVENDKPKKKFSVKTKTERPNYDPYALLDDDRNVSNQSGSTDPYSKVCDTDISEIDDPYNRVDDDDSAGTSAKLVKRSNVTDKDSDAGYSTVNKVSRVEYATVNKVSVRRKNDSDKGANSYDNQTERQVKPQAVYAPDEYSTVNKVRQEKIVNDGEIPGPSRMEDKLAPRLTQPPEEPPRDYDDDDDTDADHYNTVVLVSENRSSANTSTSLTAPVTTTSNLSSVTTTVSTISTTTATTSATIVTATIVSAVTTPTAVAGVANVGQGGKKKEPPYTKLSARESLASMNARMASNTYETVSDVDNLYATVEGGSGDGVVRPKSERHSLQGRVGSELYAEIDEPPAPAPPSLDSLHETAKQQSNQRPPGQGHTRTPSGQGHIRTPSDHIRNSGQGHFRTPSGDRHSVEGQIPLATEEIVDLDPSNYRPRAATPDDLDLEYDPNYETVEEAKSRAKYEEINGNSRNEKKIRAHVYEEVTVTNEARRARQRVLNLHTYEDITDVRELENKNRLSASAESDKSKNVTVNGKVPNVSDTGATSAAVGGGGGEGKGKKSKSDEKTKDKGKDRKKSESKDKGEKSGKVNKK